MGRTLGDVTHDLGGFRSEIIPSGYRRRSIWLSQTWGGDAFRVSKADQGGGIIDDELPEVAIPLPHIVQSSPRLH